MQAAKPLSRKTKSTKYSTNPELRKVPKEAEIEKKVEFQQTFLNPC